MARFVIERRVNAPREKVFDVFSDLERTADIVKGITKIELLTEPPVGAGSRFRETRIMFGREATEEMELTVFERPDRYVMEAETHGSHYKTSFRFKPDGANGEKTLVRVTFEAKPISLFAKVCSLFAGLMMGPVKKAFKSDLDDLQAAVEAAHASSAGGTGPAV